jgi:hypothetical protein
LNDLIGVQKIEMQEIGDLAANGRLAGAHKTNERQIGRIAGADHGYWLNVFSGNKHAINVRGGTELFCAGGQG